jgi:hypothetical protein
VRGRTIFLAEWASEPDRLARFADDLLAAMRGAPGAED